MAWDKAPEYGGSGRDNDAGRWSAGSPDLLDFVLIRDARQQLEADLPTALDSYCQRPVSYVFLRPKSLN